MPASEERYIKTYPISWEQLHRDAKALSWRLVKDTAWEGRALLTDPIVPL